jgi:predicted ArsR family transcriptional regulator
VQPVDVLDDPAAAVAALHPVRSRLLALLAAEPASAAGLAGAVGLSRQKVRYHLQALAEHGLVTEVAQHRHGGLVERVFSPTAASYLVSPAALGDAGADPRRVDDRLSAAYLVALAARAVREVGALVRRATAADQRLATLSIDADVRFRSAEERAAFAAELQAVVVDLVARYHDEAAPGGRRHRLIALVHPTPPEEPT